MNLLVCLASNRTAGRSYWQKSGTLHFKEASINVNQLCCECVKYFTNDWIEYEADLHY